MGINDVNNTDANDNTQVVLYDDSNGPIGQSSSNPLYVRNISQPVTPDQKLVHFVQKLENGGSDAMNVDGSTTPVTFSAAPGSGQKWYIVNLSVQIADSGTNKIDYFGAINGGLTNGLLIRQVVDSTNYDLATIKRNKGFIQFFVEANWFGGASSGFVTDSNFFGGSMKFAPGITLDGDNSDSFNVIVQDNLTGVDTLNMAIHYYRILS